MLVFRVLETPSAEDIAVLERLAQREGFHIYLQPGGAETIRPLPGQAVDLHYDLPRHDLRLGFDPTDFTQVNLDLNRLMIDQALDLLDPGPDERVLDLFCGIGNFTLPLARRAREVVGVEGDAGLVERAGENARRNGIGNVRFHVADLYGAARRPALDAGRVPQGPAGPAAKRRAAVAGPAAEARRRAYRLRLLLPVTLARDAERLVNGLGYRLSAAGVMDMFPPYGARGVHGDVRAAATRTIGEEIIRACRNRA